MGAPRLQPGRTEKRCPDCDTVRPLASFYKNRATADGHQGYCKKCWPGRNKSSPSQTPLVRRRHHLRRHYGITLDDYDALLAQSNGRCWACGELEIATHPSGTPLSLAVDHDHATGRVRGLLCFKCNTTIRSVGDDRGRLLDLVKYLTERQPMEFT